MYPERIHIIVKTPCIFFWDIMSSFRDTVIGLPALGSAAVAGYVLYNYVNGKSECKIRVNHCQKLDKPTVFPIFDVKDKGKKVYFCRCWKSKTLPYCDGAYLEHNAKTRDNVGPVMVNDKLKCS